MQSSLENQQAIRGRLDVLQHRLSQLEGFAYTKKLMNLDGYLKNNYNQFIKLQIELSKAKKQAQYKYKVLPSSEIDRVNKENKQITIQLNMIKFRNDQAQKQSFVPQISLPEDQMLRLKQLQGQAYDLSLKVNYLRRKNKAYNEAVKIGDMFGEYENMIRELQSHRKLSFELAEQFKHYIKEINIKTGKNDNPNTLLINLK